MRNRLKWLAAALLLPVGTAAEGIDRKAVVQRNNPVVTAIDSLSSLSVGNGGFAFTVDATGLQSFPAAYRNGVPLGTMSDWGWHSFPNTENYRAEEALQTYDFGHNHKQPPHIVFDGAETYSVENKADARAKAAAAYLRANPHRLHLGNIGFDFTADAPITDVRQQLDLWSGTISSRFEQGGHRYQVLTACHPVLDMVAATIQSSAHTPVCFRFPYPTGMHSDDACDWEKPQAHSSSVVFSTKNSALLKRQIDASTYYIYIRWQGEAVFLERQKHCFVLTPMADELAFSCQFTKEREQLLMFRNADDVFSASATHWEDYWTSGGIVDFSHCKDPRARELERRVVLSQYLLAVNCAGDTPPQETGLTYNSWFGKFHLEMIWWHQAQFALWGHPELLEHSLDWYFKARPMARQIAQRQGFRGIRWMKMTDPSAAEAPSKVGSFLIWQQPHIIYLAELLRRADSNQQRIIEKYGSLVKETADFMHSFADYDSQQDRYILKGCIPAQETLKPAETVNPPFELSYWHYALKTAAITWTHAAIGDVQNSWLDLTEKLSPLACNADSLYLAAESATDTYSDIRFTSDHMAVLGALGILPMNRLIDKSCMQRTLNWVWNHWNWDKTWGWDYPMTAMCAARLGDTEKAVGALLMDKRTNTYLVSGHNYQDGRLRLYLPGNGGLLTAVAMMCAGWDGSTSPNPGFPKDGNWDVHWEGLHPLP